MAGIVPWLTSQSNPPLKTFTPRHMFHTNILYSQSWIFEDNFKNVHLEKLIWMSDNYLPWKNPLRILSFNSNLFLWILCCITLFIEIPVISWCPVKRYNDSWKFVLIAFLFQCIWNNTILTFLNWKKVLVSSTCKKHWEYILE